MKADTHKLLEKARQAIRAAETLEQTSQAFAAGRAYYAMFYIAEAWLFELGLAFKKHGAVHAAVGQHLVKAGKLDPKFHHWLIDAFDTRIEDDYGFDKTIAREKVTRLIAQAKEFLSEATQRLAS